MPIAGYFGPRRYRDTQREGLNVLYDNLNDDVYRKIKDAGVNLIIQANTEAKGPSHLMLLALSYAEKYGLDMYVSDTNVSKATDVSQIKNSFSVFGQYNSFKGFLLVDEPSTNEYGVASTDAGFDLVSNYSTVSRLTNGFSNLVGYTNLFPYKEKLNKGSSNTAYADYLNSCLEALNPRLLSYDQYVWGPSATDVSHDASTITDIKYYFQALSDARVQADGKNIPFWSYIQAGSNWNDDKVQDKATTANKVPSQGQLLWNVNTSLAYGAKGIQYFPLIQPYYFAWEENNGFDYDRNGILGADGSKTPFYPIVQIANKQIAVVDEVLMNATSERVLAVGSYAQNETGISSNDYSSLTLEGITIKEDTEGTSEYGAVVGVFDYFGKEAYYVVNYDYMSARNVTLQFTKSCNYEILADAGNYSGTTGSASGSSCQLSLKAGGAALIVVE